MQAEEIGSECSSDRLADDVRTTAFRMLFDGRPVGLKALAARLGADAASVGSAVEQLEGDGLVRRDADGQLVGSYGLSVVPSKDVLHLPDRQLWTWCIKTALGILAGLGQGGHVVSLSPASAAELTVRFEGDQPVGAEALAVFWPSDEFSGSCSSAVDELCPNLSLFESREVAEEWARAGGVPGEVVSVLEATDRAAAKWGPLVADVPGLTVG